MMAAGLASRNIEPEVLDHLSPNDPKAVGSRRDLVLINILMFQAAIVARTIRPHLTKAPIRLLEIGSGDGSFMLSVARRIGPVWPNVDLVLLDQFPLLTERRRTQFEALGWQVTAVTEDVFEWLARPDIGVFDLVSANLFLHHFRDNELRRLFDRCASLAEMFMATEPHRNSVALWSTSLLRLIGANSVTLHDASASVRAGFKGQELSALWPRQKHHLLTEYQVGPFTQVFLARAANSGVAP